MPQCSECALEARENWAGLPVCHRCLLFHLILQDSSTGDDVAQRLLILAKKFFTSEEHQKDFVACLVEVSETAVRAEKLIIQMEEATKVAKKWNIDGSLILEAAMNLGYAVSSKPQT